MDPSRSIANRDVSGNDGCCSFGDLQKLPSYEEAIKSPVVMVSGAAPPTYAEAVGCTGPVLHSTYPYAPQPDHRDPEMIGNRPLCRTNSDLIIVRLLSGLSSERTSSSPAPLRHTQRGRRASLLSTEQGGNYQPSEYSRSLAKRVQLCFVFIVVAVIIVAGAITTSVIKSTKTDLLSPIDIPKINIPTVNPDSSNFPRPTYFSYSDWLYHRYNMSKVWNQSITTHSPSWSVYSYVYKEHLKNKQGMNFVRRNNSTQKRRISASDVTKPSEIKMGYMYASSEKITLQCLPCVFICVYLNK